MTADISIDQAAAELAKATGFDVSVLPAPQGKSTQPEDDEEWYTPREAINPPENLEALARLSTYSSVRSSIIDAVARNTVGMGYELVYAEGFEHEADDEDPEEALRAGAARLELLAQRDLRLGRPSLTDLLMAVKTDEEECGQGAIEVSRSKATGEIDGLFHVLGKRVRRLRERDGWLVLSKSADEQKAERFYNFGEKVNYDSDGRPLPSLQSRGKGWARNELLVSQLYTSESRDYGLPRDAAMAIEYLGDKLAAEYNVGFFDSGGTPPTVLFLYVKENRDGGKVTFKVDPGLPARIADTLKSDSGHRSRVALIPLPDGTGVEKVQLGETSERDMGFIQFRRDNRRRSLGSFRMAPIFIADTDDAGRYTAEVERAITLEQLFDPEQTRYEGKLRGSLLKDVGLGHCKIVFKRLAIEENSAKRGSANRMAETGTCTRREYREAHGKGPLPEAAEAKGAELEWTDGLTYQSVEPEAGQVPFGWNDAIVNIGQPNGAENRVEEGGDDQRGLKPGIGSRMRREDKEEPDRDLGAGADDPVEKMNGHVERSVEELAGDVGAWVEGATGRARRRAGGD